MTLEISPAATIRDSLTTKAVHSLLKKPNSANLVIAVTRSSYAFLLDCNGTILQTYSTVSNTKVSNSDFVCATISNQGMKMKYIYY
jgi:hypothetical protein